MNIRDALIAEHGADKLSVEADRRLRRRLGLEAEATRRAWLVPAFAFAAVAAVALLVVWQTQHDKPAPLATTAEILDVNAPATVTWFDATITTAPGTQLARRDKDLVLTEGAIQIARTHVRPLAVIVPMGRVVLASYRASIKVDRETATILIDDGSAQFVDAAGNTHTIVPGTPLTAPPPNAPAPPVQEVPAPAPKPHTPVRPAPPRPPSTVAPQPSGPPGVTPPIVRPDVPCTFKSECGEGATCRKNEHGVSVCMGNGGEGAACWFDNDCTSNLCVSRRCAP